MRAHIWETAPPLVLACLWASKTMPNATAKSKLLAILKRFEDLNPDISVCAQREINALAQECPVEYFPEIAAAVERLISLYQNTPTARVGKAILKEYFAALENSARLLAEAGEITAIPYDERSRTFSTAMVLAHGAVM